MIIDDIANEVCKVRYKAAQDRHGEIKIVVYIGIPMYRDMMCELNSKKSSISWKLIHNKTICGAKVYEVVDDYHPWRVFPLTP